MHFPLQMEKVPLLVPFHYKSCHSPALETGRSVLLSYFGYIPVHVILPECRFIPANQAARSAQISLTYLSTYCACMSNMKVQNRMSKIFFPLNSQDLLIYYHKQAVERLECTNPNKSTSQHADFKSYQLSMSANVRRKLL